MNKSIYLGGPITGDSFQNINDWREYAWKILKQYQIKGISPMRDKGFLSKEKKIADHYNHNSLAIPRGIYRRDSFDCRNCDAMLFNFSESKIVSIGSCVELGIGAALNKIIIIVTGKNQIHEHCFINELLSFKVETLDQGLDVAISVLGAY